MRPWLDTAMGSAHRDVNPGASFRVRCIHRPCGIQARVQRGGRNL